MKAPLHAPWPRRAFLALYLTLGLVIVFQSVSTVVHAHRPDVSEDDRHHMILLGSVETLGAILFLVPPAMRMGGALMLLTFATAFVVHAARGEPPWTLLLYAAATAYVMAAGTAAHRSPSPGSPGPSRSSP